MKLYVKLVYLFLILAVAVASHAQEQIRTQIREPKTMLTFKDSADDSLGIPFSANSVQDFTQRMHGLLQTQDRSSLQGSTLWILGVSMRDEARVHKDFNQALVNLGLQDQKIRLKIMSVPERVLRQKSESLARDVLEQTLYNFPSVRRDYQKPQLAEVINEHIVSAAIAIPTFVFLFSTMEPAAAYSTAFVHATLLSATSIFSKTILNWMLRKEYISERANEFQLFIKQIALSLPFALTFSIVPHAQELQTFLINTPWADIIQASAQQTGKFVITQGFGMVLQALFYSQVMVNGLAKWVANQKNEAASKAARSVRPWLALPILSIDAFLFAMASSSGGESVFHSQYLTINQGHLGLMALIVGGGVILQKYSHFLNVLLPRSARGVIPVKNCAQLW